MAATIRMITSAFALGAAVGAFCSLNPAAATDDNPIAVRNDIARPREEVLVLRNHRLQKGGNEPFYRASRDDVWPLFERNGSRVVGQWKVLESKNPARQT